MRQSRYDRNTLIEMKTRELTLDLASYAPYQKVPKHSHESAFFCLALQGVCTENYGRKVRTYEPSSLSFLPAGEMHSLEFYKKGMRSFGIEIKLPLMEKFREYSLSLDESIHCRGGQLSLLFKKVYNEFCERDDTSPLAIEGIVLEMLAEVSRKQANKETKPSKRCLKIATEIIHERFSDCLTLEEISTEVGVHPVYLSRVFRQHYRCTIGDYIRRLRIEYASHQIQTTETPLLEISVNAGFSDQSHFSRIFKRQMGITPTKYRAIFSKS